MSSVNNSNKYIYVEKNATLDVQLFTRKSKTKGYVGILCHIAVNKRRTRQPFATGIKLPRQHWDADSKQITAPGYELQKSELSRMVQNIHYLFLERLNNGLPYDAEIIKRLYKNPQDFKDSSVKGITHLHLKKYENNLRYAFGTKKRVAKYAKRINEFFKDKDATELQDADLDNFYVWLTGKHNNSHNTAVRAVEFLKAALETGHKKGHLPFVPCYQYEIKRKRTGKKSYLSKKELDILTNAHFLNKNLAFIRDVFVFCCYTGLDYGDSKAFTRAWVKEHDGIEYIDYHRSKTGFNGFVPFFAVAKAIAEKYDYSLPVTSNQNHNKLIKQACYMAGISKEKAQLISTHSARVTAGMVWLNAGMSLETVQKMLAHQLKDTTQRYYAEIELETIIEESKKLKGFLVG